MPWGMFASECAEYAQRPFLIAMVTMLFSSTLTENALRYIFVFFALEPTQHLKMTHYTDFSQHELKMKIVSNDVIKS